MQISELRNTERKVAVMALEHSQHVSRLMSEHESALELTKVRCMDCNHTHITCLWRWLKRRQLQRTSANLREEMRRLEYERLSLQAQVTTLAAELTAVTQYRPDDVIDVHQAHRLVREERQRRLEAEHDAGPATPKPGKLNVPNL